MRPSTSRTTASYTSPAARLTPTSSTATKRACSGSARRRASAITSSGLARGAPNARTYRWSGLVRRVRLIAERFAADRRDERQIAELLRVVEPVAHDEL